MFTMKDMLYFTLPNPSALDAKDKVLVTDTAYDRNSALAGTIVKIKTGHTLLNGKVWKTTEDGSYVTGHCLSQRPGYGSVIVGTVDGDENKFYLGEYREADRADGLVLISDAYNSRAEYAAPSMEGHYSNRVRLNNWTKAAPWAASLMPRVGDSHGTLATKLELAKAKWELNRAVLEMAHEGYQRNWTEQLDELHENAALDFLPRPRLGVMVYGEVLIPSGERRPAESDLTPAQQEKFSALRGKTADIVTLRQPKIPVGIALPLDLKLDPKSMDAAATTDMVSHKAREVLNDPEITLGDHTLKYFVNGLSQYI